MTSTPPLPLYYAGKTLTEMERMLRLDYLSRSGWLESAESKLAQRGGEPIPWFTYSAIAFLERELAPDVAMFEYGGGQSSLYWAARLRRLVSIDHDPAFAALIRPSLPAHAEFRVVPESHPLPNALEQAARGMPEIIDPSRNEQTWRSGQLNHAFRSYGLQVLGYPQNMFDVVVIDGMARVLSTWAAIQHFSRRGFIIFDNSDRDFYARAYDMLADAGYRRIDFRGMGPVNPYEWCTSIFYHHRSFTSVRWFAPGERLEAKVPSDQADGADAVTLELAETENELGILVLGYNRPWHLQSVLESLRQQGRLCTTHVWIDGTQGRGEFAGANDDTAAVAGRYSVVELRVHRSHLGIEKMMLDALKVMSQRYNRLLVLEDDCFPLEGAVDDFEQALQEIADRPEVYSVYGHAFGTEPSEVRDFTRFQGWGWAAWSNRIRVLLHELEALFALDEAGYCARVATEMTEDIQARLDVTPGRDVLKVLQSFFSWDSATAFLSAQRGLTHRRTARPAVVNTGIHAGIGHFTADLPRFRSPPFNMITLQEAWSRYDRTTLPCDGQRPSYGLDELDLRLIEALGDAPAGFFVELGAHDGVTQSNSVLLERRGWKGLLIEANPACFARCVKSRPGSIVEHAACVAADFKESHVLLTDVGLMGLTARSAITGAAREEWLERGEQFSHRGRQEIVVPALTLSTVLDRHDVCTIDLLLLDVEGAEVDVLRGLDFARHAPRMILAEDSYSEDVASFLDSRGYTRTSVLLERKFTRDCLYSRRPEGAA